ncbi:cytochrome b-c1 complex subunit 2, mitochondrial-like [Scyliorhinus canicula]|uniref:cytochrome b-c1 complex subunit 2, mitochondrial-like n=1 Tax=Scyliorhinus canicula TaxID=7830 RepID=UPI0018F72438|nr:cytochrome b-c1 complex subunit 2, mitochondrial-like [Scyliorhinus canicula]
MLLSGCGRLLGRGASRCYSVHTTPLTQPLKHVKRSAASKKLEPQDIQISKLRNGLVIASLENYSPVSKVGIFVKAGSRYEGPGNLGITHCLRVAANMTSRGASAFKLNRAIEAVGGNLRVTSTRDTMMYSVECMRDYMRSLALSTSQRLNSGANTMLPRYPRRSSLKGQSKKLHKYVKKHYCVGQMVLVGIGVAPSQLTKAAQELFGKRTGYGQSAAKALYAGGEHRDPNCERLVHAAVVSEGAALSAPESLPFTVLQHVLGVGAHVKRGSDITSTLTRAVSKATAQPFTASAFNASYQDSGLFGVYTVSQDESAADVINAAVSHVKQVAEGKIAEEDIERGKNQLTARSLIAMETLDALLEEVGSQVLVTGTYISPASAVEQIKEITKKDVVKAAKMFASGSKSMAVSGRLINTPFLDQL